MAKARVQFFGPSWLRYAWQSTSSQRRCTPVYISASCQPCDSTGRRHSHGEIEETRSRPGRTPCRRGMVRVQGELASVPGTRRIHIMPVQCCRLRGRRGGEVGHRVKYRAVHIVDDCLDCHLLPFVVLPRPRWVAHLGCPGLFSCLVLAIVPKLGLERLRRRPHMPLFAMQPATNSPACSIRVLQRFSLARIEVCNELRGFRS